MAVLVSAFTTYLHLKTFWPKPDTHAVEIGLLGKNNKLLCDDELSGATVMQCPECYDINVMKSTKSMKKEGNICDQHPDSSQLFWIQDEN